MECLSQVGRKNRTVECRSWMRKVDPGAWAGGRGSVGGEARNQWCHRVAAILAGEIASASATAAAVPTTTVMMGRPGIDGGA